MHIIYMSEDEMWPKQLVHLLKRRLLYIMLIVLPLGYYLTKIIKQHHDLSRLTDEKDYTLKRTKPLMWRNLQEYFIQKNYTINIDDISCRNTIQGRDLLTDERGFLCQRKHILNNGCCNIEVPETLYYSCHTCDNNTHCCQIYEYCVSCCLHPDKRPVLEIAMDSIKGKQSIVYAQVADQFELCLVKCRTNSHSVEHENRYRYDHSLFCYGQTEPNAAQKMKTR